jgi:Domain of unknown function (DUF397)
MMSASEPDSIIWHTSSYSTNQGSCVEVAPAPEGILIRDSKNPAGPALALPTPAWQAFLTTLTP